MSYLCVTKQKKIIMKKNQKRATEVAVCKGIYQRKYPTGTTSYRIRFMLNGENIHLGTVDSLKTAVKNYNTFMSNYFGSSKLAKNAGYWNSVKF